MISVLSLLVPLVFVVSILGRPISPEANDDIPSTVELPETIFTAETGEAGIFTGQPAMRYRILETADGQRRAIELSATESLRIPELLVYWSSNSNAESLSDNHVLIGSWPVTFTRTFELPVSAPGAIVLYSLSQQEVVASTPLN